MSFDGIAPINSCVKQLPALGKPVFIADLHLSNDKQATKEAFFQFLRRDAIKFNELIILGDLFEFWAGDDHIDAFPDIINALKNYRLLGKSLYAMHGNRDFLLGKVFEKQTGAILISDPVVTYAGHERILLSHGDEWCTLDKDYQQFRSTLRNPDVQVSILQEKLKHRIDLANSLRDQSKDENTHKSYELMDVVVHDVARAARQANVATVIHGHTHKPAHHTHVNDDFCFDRWVLPDWDFENGKTRGGYLSYEGGFLHFERLS